MTFNKYWLLGIVIFIAGCGGTEYRCSSDITDKLQTSFDACVERTGNPDRCAIATKKLYCDAIVKKESM